MKDYGNRLAIAQLLGMFLAGLGMIAGLTLATNGADHITNSINALTDSDYLAGSSEEFGSALYSLVGGGMITGFFIAVMLWLLAVIYRQTR